MNYFVVGDVNFNTRGNFNVTTFKNVDIKSKRIDLNSTTGDLYTPELIDNAVLFETNIVKLKPEETQIEPGVEYPDNPEQVEQTDGKNPEDVKYPEKTPATCGSPDNPHRNPIDVAIELMNEGGWKETVVILKLSFFGTRLVIMVLSMQIEQRGVLCLLVQYSSVQVISIYKQHHHKHTLNMVLK